VISVRNKFFRNESNEEDNEEGQHIGGGQGANRAQRLVKLSFGPGTPPLRRRHDAATTSLRRRHGVPRHSTRSIRSASTHISMSELFREPFLRDCFVGVFEIFLRIFTVKPSSSERGNNEYHHASERYSHFE